MKKPDWNAIWQYIRKYLVNKYFITVMLFAVVLTFCGSHSLVHRVRMSRDIRQKQTELREYQQKIDETERYLRNLQNPDSLERYAREHYLMHTPDEDVYVIEE